MDLPRLSLKPGEGWLDGGTQEGSPGPRGLVPSPALPRAVLRLADSQTDTRILPCQPLHQTINKALLDQCIS